MIFKKMEGKYLTIEGGLFQTMKAENSRFSLKQWGAVLPVHFYCSSLCKIRCNEFPILQAKTENTENASVHYIAPPPLAFPWLLHWHICVKISNLVFINNFGRDFGLVVEGVSKNLVRRITNFSNWGDVAG